jgi:hypothetical protein
MINSFPINSTNTTPPEFPWCAKCNRPVDRLDSFYDPIKDRKVFRATCHGENEVHELDALTEMIANHIDFGTAFRSDHIS